MTNKIIVYVERVERVCGPDGIGEYLEVTLSAGFPCLGISGEEMDKINRERYEAMMSLHLGTAELHQVSR